MATAAALAAEGNNFVSTRDLSAGISSRVAARDWNISEEHGIFPARPPFTVSLVFPRNETYKSTQYLPIVFAVSNTDFVWPLGLGISLTIKNKAAEAPDLWNGYFYFPNRTTCNDTSSGQICDGVTAGTPPTSPYYFGIDASSVINSTESAQFVINWSLVLKNVCTEEHGTPRPQTHLFSNNVQLRFSVSPHATQPDIEGAVNACPQDSMTIAPHASYYRCPLVLHDDGQSDVIWMDPGSNGTNSTPPCDDLKPYAKEISEKVSSAMLAKMGCKDGWRQDIAAPCPVEEQKNWGRGRVEDMMSWMSIGVAGAMACILLAAI